jgi:hypothetical protein
LTVGATLAVARNDNLTGANRAGASPAPTIGNIVGAFKSLCFNKYKKHVEKNSLNAKKSFFQRNYYEHIIRDEESYGMIYSYIESNPQTWNSDMDNPANHRTS